MVLQLQLLLFKREIYHGILYLFYLRPFAYIYTRTLLFTLPCAVWQC
jgi:hypothetical protein